MEKRLDYSNSRGMYGSQLPFTCPQNGHFMGNSWGAYNNARDKNGIFVNGKRAVPLSCHREGSNFFDITVSEGDVISGNGLPDDSYLSEVEFIFVPYKG